MMNIRELIRVDLRKSMLIFNAPYVVRSLLMRSKATPRKGEKENEEIKKVEGVFSASY
jgi:hypothetical protein